MLYSVLTPPAREFYRITIVFNQNHIRNEYDSKIKCQYYNMIVDTNITARLVFIYFFTLIHLQRSGELREGFSVHAQFNNPDSKSILKLSKRFMF